MDLSHFWWDHQQTYYREKTLLKWFLLNIGPLLLFIWWQIWVQICCKCELFSIYGEIDEQSQYVLPARESLCNWDLCDTVRCSAHHPPVSPVVSKRFSVDLYAASWQALEQVFRRKRVPTMHQLHPQPQLSTAHSHSSHIPFTDILV